MEMPEGWKRLHQILTLDFIERAVRLRSEGFVYSDIPSLDTQALDLFKEMAEALENAADAYRQDPYYFTSDPRDVLTKFKEWK